MGVGGGEKQSLCFIYPQHLLKRDSSSYVQVLPFSFSCQEWREESFLSKGTCKDSCTFSPGGFICSVLLPILIQKRGTLWTQPWKCLVTWNTAGWTQFMAGLTETSLLWSHPGFNGNRFSMAWFLNWPETGWVLTGAACSTFILPLIEFPPSWKEIQQNLRASEEKEISLTLLLRVLLVFCELPLEGSDCR